jgi:hypothetical protein
VIFISVVLSVLGSALARVLLGAEAATEIRAGFFVSHAAGFARLGFRAV